MTQLRASRPALFQERDLKVLDCSVAPTWIYRYGARGLEVTVNRKLPLYLGPTTLCNGVITHAAASQQRTYGQIRRHWPSSIPMPIHFCATVMRDNRLMIANHLW